MRTVVPVAAAIMWCILAATACAGDAGVQALVRTFDTMCVQGVPDLERIAAQADAMGLKDISRIKSAPPSARDDHARSWRIIGIGGSPVSLTLNEGREDGKRVAVCALTSFDAEPVAAEQELQAAFQLGRPFRTDTSGGQNYLDWNKRLNDRTIIISAVDATPSGRQGINFAATVIDRVRR